MTARRLAQMLECATGREVKQVNLGSSELDDDLWGSTVIRYDKIGASVVWHRGQLANLGNDSREDEQRLRLVLIPDLTRLSSAAARACVMLVGADVAHLERYGQDEIWQPDICWLASCPRDRVGAISPHLLDRFTLRLQWPGSHQLHTVAGLLHRLLNAELPESTTMVSLPSDVKDQISRAAQFMPTASYDAITRVLHYTSGSHSPRREITLAHLAQAIARLAGKSQVAASHVDSAARLIGLVPETRQTDEHEQAQEGQIPNPSTVESNDLQIQYPPELKAFGSSSVAHDSEGEPSEFQAVPIYEPGQMVVVDKVLLPANPYPEDSASIEREFASLRLPLFRNSATRTGRGPVIGVERSNRFIDLAPVHTLLAAAPFQPIRHKHRQVDNHRLVLSATDLRSYRHEPVAEQMLLLLLDYTSMHDCDWQRALRPYLSWAYIERASISIVQVGMASAFHEYRAQLVNARSILVPGIAACLGEKPGKATPLAHGLDLALRTVQHALQQGRSAIEQALLIVISDGRGNVPLEASRNGNITGQISCEGIEDALQIAQHISNLKDVQTVLLNPQPAHYSELPLTLARTLGAQIINIRRNEDVVEESL
ncbi:MAG TPA: hypothetical protein VKR83_06650 [Ktedonobacteraceae bacterium]|nr:hypothetical protein [Ktedonobacteraceae bacterium]